MDIVEAGKKLSRLLEETGITCPVCDQAPWETGKLYGEDKLKYKGPTDPIPLEELEAVCSCCGYVLRFKIENLLKWESSTPKRRIS